jgi:hypothetical protein
MRPFQLLALRIAILFQGRGMQVPVPKKVYDGLTGELPVMLYFVCTFSAAMGFLFAPEMREGVALLVANVVGLLAACFARWMATRYVRPPSDDELTREVMADFNERGRNATGRR